MFHMMDWRVGMNAVVMDQSQDEQVKAKHKVEVMLLNENFSGRLVLWMI